MISVKNLSFNYPGTSNFSLKNLNFEIGEGEIFGFLGPSGAGKSTTQKILYKILNRFKGEIIINNKPLAFWGKHYFEMIGVGFELPNHYLKLTARENLALFASFYDPNKITDFDLLFAQVGLDGQGDMPVDQYSKGMMMRLNFIRSIMHNPNILFFDEPTSGMDPVNAAKIKNLIQDLREQGKTIFITTHDMYTADELCDRVAFIMDGELRMIEKPEILKRKYGKQDVTVTLTNQESSTFPLTGLGQNIEFLNFIKNDNILRINSNEASLEHVFIQVTGKQLKG